MLSMTSVAEGMVRRSQGFGDWKATLRISIPLTITRPKGHPFHVRKSDQRREVEFKDVRGAWIMETQENPEGMGQEQQIDGRCVIFHQEADITHDELRVLLGLDGADVFWDGVKIITRDILPDAVQGATVITFLKHART
jgi:hypothetical protein